MPLQYGPVYSALAEAASGYSLPPAWSWLPVDSDCLVLVDAAATFQHLMERFPGEDLVASGVAERAEEGLVISPRLIAQDPGFIVLRTATGDPFDIVTSVGCLTGVPPALKMFHDGKTKEAIRGSQYKIMYGVSSLLDAVLLRSLRVAVTPATLLEALNLSGLQRLLALTGGTARGDIPKRRVRMSTDEEADEERRDRGVSDGRLDAFLLVLVAGTIASTSAEIPEALTDAARHLAGAETHLGFRWEGISVWHPAQAELDSILYRRQLGSARALRIFFGRYLGNHRLQAFEYPGPPSVPKPTPAEEYFDLIRKLQTSTNRPRSFMTDPGAVRQDYDLFVDEHFVRPFVEKALQSKAPEDRALCMELAAVSRLYHRVAPAVYDSQCQSADAVWKNNGESVPRELLRQFELLGGTLLKLVRQQKNIEKESWGIRR